MSSSHSSLGSNCSRPNAIPQPFNITVHYGAVCHPDYAITSDAASLPDPRSALVPIGLLVQIVVRRVFDRQTSIGRRVLDVQIGQQG